MRARLYLFTAVLTSLVVVVLAGVSAAVTSIAGGQEGDGEEGANPSGWEVPTITPNEPPARLASTPPPTAAEPGLDLSADVRVDSEGFFSWAALDRHTGELAGSSNLAKTSTTESVIKVWIVADFLRRHANADREPSEAELADARRAIRDSHDGAAQRLYNAGGRDAVIKRLIDICGLTDTEIYPDWWSRTEISARDTVRMGECIADGTAAGPDWTDWLLEEMTKVRGSTDPDDQPAGGRWGIIDGLPEEVVEQGVSIKNGWTAIGRTNSWHMNCLAITDDWVMAVVMRYPADKDVDYGARRCASVAQQLVRPPAPAPAPAQMAAG